MKRWSPLIAYTSLITLFHTATDGFSQTDIIKYCSLKFSPILLLSALAFCDNPEVKGKHRSRFALGLLFGGIGDFLLSTNELGFLLGTISFGIGHILYIAYFGTRLTRLSTAVSFLCAMNALCISHFFVIPNLGHDPVKMFLILAYTFVICAAVIVAGSLFQHGCQNGLSGKNYSPVIIGYILFITSDTAILLAQIGYNFQWEKEFIYFTYYAAQYLIYHNGVTTQTEC